MNRPPYARKINQVRCLTTGSIVTKPSDLDSWINWKWLLSDDGFTPFTKLYRIMSDPDIISACQGKRIDFNTGNYVLDINSQNFIEAMAISKGLSTSVCPICDGWKSIYLEEIRDLNPIQCFCSLLEDMEGYSQYQYLESQWAIKDKQSFNPGKSQALAVMLQVTDGFILDPSKNWLGISGGVGIGKTHMLWMIKTEYRGLAFFFSCQDFSNVYKMMDEKKGELDQLRWMMKNTPLLLLDDVGAQNQTPFLTSILFDVLNHRVVDWANRPVAFTTNLSSTQLLELGNNEVGRIGDRLTNKQVVEFFAPSAFVGSYRQKMKGGK